MVTLKCETIKIPRNEYIYIYIYILSKQMVTLKVRNNKDF